MHRDKKYSWQEAMVKAVTDPAELLQLLNLNPNLLEAAKKASQVFPLRVPRGFLSLIEKGNLHDPLLKQILPLSEELENVSGFKLDPLEEIKSNPIPGLLHKYQGRVLVMLTGVCGVNCRYCFRRYFPYEDNILGSKHWEKMLSYLAKDSSIHEVILSGGDPLVATDETLKKFIELIEAIPHIKRFRIHSRLPIVIPERITLSLVDIMSSTRLGMVFVTHCNHPNEITHQLKIYLKLLKEVGILLLNQSVLLKGVNDDADTLVRLSEKLFEVGIQPYYLHLLDKVHGSAHFDVDKQIASQLQRSMMKKLPGYLVPKVVCEQPDSPSKIPLHF